MGESSLQNAIRMALAGKGLFFRSNVGSAWVGEIARKTPNSITLVHPRLFRSGLPKGFSDLVGCVPVVITPEMVGQTIGVFTAIEVKTPRGKVSNDQAKFLKAVTCNGGRAAVVRSVDEAIKAISENNTM